MTFKHKLSVRLALMRDALLLVPMTGLLACEKPVPAGPDPIVTNVAVFPAHITLHTKQTSQFIAVGLTPTGDTANIDVTWTATGGSIADTFSNGRQHVAEYQPSALPGTYLVVAADGLGGTADTGMVTVIPTPVASVALSPAVASVLVGATLQLTATPQDSSGSSLSGRVVTWTSSAPSVASVGANGLVTGLVAGSATVTATSEGQSGTAAVTVTNVPVSTVAVSPATASLQVGGNVQLTATAQDASGNALSGRVVTWSTSNPAVASVSSTGLVTGVAAGSVIITATSEGKSGTAAATVVSVPVASVAVSPATASVQVGATVQLAATPTDANGNVLSGRGMTWSSSAPAVASVTSSGLVTGLAAGSATVTATSEGQSGTAGVTVTNVPVSSVAVSPATASLQLAATVQLAATPKDANGNALSGRVVTWSSSAPTVASVTSSGLVTGVAAGSATISATSEGKSGTSAITVQAAATPRPGFYVTPTGSASGDGSASRPWNLATALAGAGGRVQPGDTIWLRGGTYTGYFLSYLRGTAAQPIIVRQYPGERATIVGNASGTLALAYSAHTWYWGFEVTNPNNWVTGINNQSTGGGIKLINLVVHDNKGNGIGDFHQAVGSEIYGCLSYNNGSVDYNDHGIYVLNNRANGTKFIRDNIVFNNWSYGIHAYGSAGQFLTGMTFEGNVVFDNGLIGGPATNEVLIGGNVAADAIVFSRNYVYRTYPSSSPLASNYAGVDLGYWVGGQLNGSLVVEDNYVVGGIAASHWATATVRNNTLYDYNGQLVNSRGNLAGHTYSGNTAFGNPAAAAWVYAPNAATTLATWMTQTGFTNPANYAGATPPNLVVVRPNRFEAGRANIIVYNWERHGSVSVDVSGVLQAGDRYIVQNVQDFYETPVASGTYTGGALQLPMTGILPPVPIGRSSVPAPITGPTFNVFVVMKAP